MNKITMMSLSIKSLTIVMVLVIMMASLPIIYINAQQQNGSDTTNISQSLSELINSVAILVGVVAPLIVSGLAYVKAKSQDPKIKEAAETGIHVGQLAPATANKALENKQNIKELIDFSLKVVPEEAAKIV